MRPDLFPAFLKARPSFRLKLRQITWIDEEDLFPMFYVEEMKAPGTGVRALETFLRRALRRAQRDRASISYCSSTFRSHFPRSLIPQVLDG